MDIHQDREQKQFNGLVKQLLRRDGSHTTDFSSFTRKTESLHFGRLTYPNATFFNRFSKNNLYFDSPACSRAPSSGMCNSFVRYRMTDEECLGKILYFLPIPDEPFDGKVQASVQEYEIFEEIGPLKGFFYFIKRTDYEDLADVDSVTKVFCVPFWEIECSVIKFCTSFAHS